MAPDLTGLTIVVNNEANPWFGYHGIILKCEQDGTFLVRFQDRGKEHQRFISGMDFRFYGAVKTKA